MHPHDAATLIVLAVALISLGLAFIAWRSMRRSGNQRLGFVMAAFLTFFVKGLVVTAALQWGTVAHEHLEIISSLFDLLAVTLLVLPLVR